MTPGPFGLDPVNRSATHEEGCALTTFGDADLHELLTVDEIAALLKVSKSWVYEHTRGRGTPRSDRLPYIKLGKYVRFDTQAVRAFLNRRGKTT
jgi:excisionase family DNA binding protein